MTPAETKVRQHCHEKRTGDSLLGALGIQAEFLRHGDEKSEPDLLYTIGGQTVGIEVTSAYYDRNHASAEWSPDTPEVTAENPEWRPYWSGECSVSLLAASAQKQLTRKAGKPYRGADSIWLCLHCDGAINDVAEYEALAKNLRIPDAHVFQRFFLTVEASLFEWGGFRAFDLQTGGQFGRPSADPFEQLPADQKAKLEAAIAAELAEESGNSIACL